MVQRVAFVGMKMMPSILTSGASWMVFVILSVAAKYVDCVAAILLAKKRLLVFFGSFAQRYCHRMSILFRKSLNYVSVSLFFRLKSREGKQFYSS